MQFPSYYLVLIQFLFSIFFTVIFGIFLGKKTVFSIFSGSCTIFLANIYTVFCFLIKKNNNIYSKNTTFFLCKIFFGKYIIIGILGYLFIKLSNLDWKLFLIGILIMQFSFFLIFILQKFIHK